MNCLNLAPGIDTSLPTRDIGYSVAFSFMSAMTITWALSAIGFLFGASFGRLQSSCGVLLAVFLLLRQYQGGRARGLSLSWLVAILAGCLLISAMTVDLTYDGWAYHQPGVIALSHGWNPLTEPVFGTWWARYSRTIGYPYNGPSIDAVSTTVYPKALWILGAQAVVWGMPLDAGKYPALLLIFVVGPTALRALQLRGIANSWAYPLSLIAALNPVCVVQSTTFYVDGALGSCLAILIFSLLSYDVTRSRRDLAIALCAALIACNLKFTGPLYTLLILLPFAIWWLVERRWVARDLLICGIAAAVLLATSINPYFTNLRDFGSPMYPLNSLDIMEDQMSAGFLKEHSVKKLLISLTFSNLADRSFDNPATEERNFTSPFQSRGFEELKKFGGTADLRIGGFGPFFGITLAVTLLAASLLIRGRGTDIGLAAVALGTVLSVIVNPQMWWARFVPQMWLLPVLAASAASRSHMARALAMVIVLLLGVTSLIAVIGRATSAYVFTLAFDDNLKRLGDAPLLVDTSVAELNFLPTLTYRLHQQGTTFEVGQGQCAIPIDLVKIQGCRNDGRGR